MDKTLLEALTTGDIKKLEELVANGIDIKQKDEEGCGALLYAARYGQIAMFEHLLEKQYCTVHEKDNNDNTAVLIAAFYGKIAMVDHLFAKKHSQLNERNNDGYSALFCAISDGEIDMVDHLLTKKYSQQNEKDNEGNTPLYCAVNHGMIAMVDHLIVKKYSQKNEKQEYNGTILHRAAHMGHTDLCKHLLAKKYFDIDEKDLVGYTVLHHAAANNNFSMVEYLSAMQDFDINVRGNDGETALSISAMYGYTRLFEFLLKKGSYIDIELIKKSQFVPLMKFVERYKDDSQGNSAVMSLLDAAQKLLMLAKGKQISESALQLCQILKDNLNARLELDGGNTALHFALIQKNAALAKLLIRQGADLLKANQDGKTPIDLGNDLFMAYQEPFFSLLQQIYNIVCIGDKVKEQNTLSGNATASTSSSSQTETDTKALLKQCEDSISSVKESLDKLSFEDHCFISTKLGMILSNRNSPLYNPAEAYFFLAKAASTKLAPAVVHNTLVELLISGDIILQIDELEDEPLAMAVAGGLDTTEDAKSLQLRLRTIVHHIVYSDHSIHEGTLGKYIAEFALGAEESLSALSNMSGNNPQSWLHLVDSYKKKADACKEYQKTLIDNEKIIEDKDTVITNKDLIIKQKDESLLAMQVEKQQLELQLQTLIKTQNAKTESMDTNDDSNSKQEPDASNNSQISAPNSPNNSMNSITFSQNAHDLSLSGHKRKKPSCVSNAENSNTSKKCTAPSANSKKQRTV